MDLGVPEDLEAEEVEVEVGSASGALPSGDQLLVAAQAVKEEAVIVRLTTIAPAHARLPTQDPHHLAEAVRPLTNQDLGHPHPEEVVVDGRTAWSRIVMSPNAVLATAAAHEAEAAGATDRKPRG